jgi:hypothetical protein
LCEIVNYGISSSLTRRARDVNITGMPSMTGYASRSNLQINSRLVESYNNSPLQTGHAKMPNKFLSMLTAASKYVNQYYREACH